MSKPLPTSIKPSVGKHTYLKEMMDMFSKSTGLNVVAVDMQGIPFLSSESYESVDFCQYIKHHTPDGCNKCQKTYQKACRESFRWHEPYFFTCHAGLVMWSVPIILNQVPIGAMICGQVLLWELDELFFEDLKQFHINLPLDSMEHLKKSAGKLKVISVKQCQSSANLLFVIMKFMADISDTNFTEQKNLMEWRNTILSRLEEQKSSVQEEVFDFSVYLKRERRFLQALRLANKSSADKLIPLLFTDIEMLSNHRIQNIRQMLEELITLSSRALMEAGIDSLTVIEFTKIYRVSLKNFTHSEELFQYTYDFFVRLLDSTYSIIPSIQHTSVIKNAKKYIEDHYNEKITMADIAESVSLSSSYLSLLFKQKMKISMHDYLIRVRIEKSIELMNNRNLSILEIMTQCGFESQSYYNKVFKKIIGVTPGKYRNQLL